METKTTFNTKFFLKLIFIFLLIPILYWNHILDLWKPNAEHTQIDKIEVIKSARILRTYKKTNEDWELIKEYKVALGKNPIAHKEKEGDYRTPEGHYSIIRKNPNSAYFLSLEISYPNEQDKLNAKQKGVNPGKNIMIHGIINGLGWVGKSHLLSDWTKGCIAVTNEEMQEIYDNVKVGTPIFISP